MANDRKILGITLTAEGTEDVAAAFRSLGKEGQDAAKRIRESFENVNFKGDLTGVVKKELGALGKAGEDAAKKINTALEKVGVGETVTARIVRLRRSFADLAETTKLTRAGFLNIKNGADTMVAGVDRAVKTIGLLSVAIGGAVAATTLLAKRSADTAEQIQNQADAFGISFENMQRLRNVISDVGGDEGLLERAFTKFTAGLNGTNEAAESAEAALVKLQKAKAEDIKKADTQAERDKVNSKYRDKLAEATQKLEKAQAIFNSTTESGFDGALEYAKRLNTLTNSQEQLAQVTKDFGARGAVTLLAFFKALTGEFDAVQNAADKMLPALDQIGQTSLAQLDTASDKLGTNFSRLALLVGSRIAPAFTAVYDIIREIVGTVGPALADAFGSVATAIATQVTANKGAILDFAKEVTASAIGIARDISQALSGVNSGATSNWIVRLKNDVVGAFEFMRATVSNVLLPAFRAFGAALEPIARLLNALFGSEFTGNGLAAVAIFAQLTGGVKLLQGAFEIAWGAGKVFFDLIFNGKAKVLALIDVMKNLMAVAKATSAAVVAIVAANPVLATLVVTVGLVAAGTYLLVTRQTEAEAAAEAHDAALQSLNEAYDKVEAGVAGAADAYEREKRAQLDAAESALTASEARVSAIQAEIDAMVAQGEAMGALGKVLEGYSNVTLAFNRERLAESTAAMRINAQTVTDLRNRIRELENPNRRLAKTTNDIAASMTQATKAADGLQAGYKRITLLGPDGFKKVFDVPSQALLDAQTRAAALKDTLSEPGNNALLEEAKTKAQEFIASMDALGVQIQTSLINISADASAQLQALADAIPAFFDGVPDALRSIFAGVGDGLVNAWRSAMQAIVSQTQQMVTSVSNLISSLEATLARLSAAIASASARASGSGSGGGGGRGFATGGMVRGPGTGTSDSIPAWLSNNEYVLRAAAVRRLPLSFLNMLNSAQFDLGDIIRRFMGSQMRFAAGGLVRQPRLAMSGVGVASAGGPLSPVTLVFGGESFPGFSGGADAIARLERAIKGKRIRSTGRPSPYER